MSTQAKYETQIRRHILPAFGEMRQRSLGRRRRCGTATNSTEGVRIGRKKLVREERLLTSHQVCAIRATVQRRERFMVQIMFGLGLRVSECLGLEMV